MASAATPIMNVGPPPGTHQSLILPPLTPSEFLEHLTSHGTYPSTAIICWPKGQFLAALTQDVLQQQPRGQEEEEEVEEGAEAEDHGTKPQMRHHHPLLRASLMQTAVARHINMVFAPTVAHLRAYLATLTLSEIKVAPPPAAGLLIKPPLLMVYGLVELHRDGMDWSAQGLSFSAAVFVEAAWRSGFRAAILEPRRTQDGKRELGQSLGEKVPVLTGTPVKDDGSWAGPSVGVGHVLGSWFDVEASRWG